MKSSKRHERTRAQESSSAIERLYITMRHLFNRGFYKPMGVSGETLREALLTLRPEIYGSIADEKVELNGLLYVIDRLPQGIEECRFINLTSDEGYKESHFEPIVPAKRRRNCYRIDEEQMNIEVTRGRSEIYDILTHITFLFIESHKVMRRISAEDQGNFNRDWQKLAKIVITKKKLSKSEKEVALTHAASILGRTFEEVATIYGRFAVPGNSARFLQIIYWLGKLAMEEDLEDKKRVVTFSPVLRERLGHHIHGEIWANNVKSSLDGLGLLERPIHIISANMHSVMNTLYAPMVLDNKDVNRDIDNDTTKSFLELFEALSDPQNEKLRTQVKEYALLNGMTFIKDNSGANINVQLVDLGQYEGHFFSSLGKTFKGQKPVIIVMDYAFGEQAYETMDELLKPYKVDKDNKVYLDVKSVSIMGKAGILEGGKGDIMIPNAHLYEGTADNYPFKNQLQKSDFENADLETYEGAMVTVLGTSLQNRDILRFFHESTWNVIGLEMEGAHYQKAIQAASRLRGSINPSVKVSYAYYASDNPLETGSTLASGGLGTSGVKPTYLITEKILQKLLD